MESKKIIAIFVLSLIVSVFFQSAWVQYWHFTGYQDYYEKAGIA